MNKSEKIDGGPPLTANQKVCLAEKIKEVLSLNTKSSKIARRIYLENFAQFLWAMRRMTFGSETEKKGAAYWCMKESKHTIFRKKKLHHETQVPIRPGVKHIYVDAGTINNGQVGKQRTTIAAIDESGRVIFEQEVGDKTNNEGEILVIIRTLQISHELKEPFQILSDSRVAIGWATKGKTKKAPDRNLLARQANDLLLQTDSTLTWIPRDKNKAGQYLEEKYSI